MKKNGKNKGNDGKKFEKIVNQILSFFVEGKISHNIKVKGIISGRNRQIDNLIEGFLGPIPVKVEVECKDYKNPVSIDKIDSLSSKIQDTGVNFGIIISSGGFQKSIIDYASKKNVILMELIGNNIVDNSEFLIPMGCEMPYIKKYSFVWSGRSSGPGFSIPILTQEEMEECMRFEIGDKGYSPSELLLYAWNNGKIKQETGEQIANFNAMTFYYTNNPKHVQYMEVKINVKVESHYYFSFQPIFGVKQITTSGDKSHVGLKIHIDEIEKNWELIDSKEELENKIRNNIPLELPVKYLILKPYYSIFTNK